MIKKLLSLIFVAVAFLGCSDVAVPKQKAITVDVKKLNVITIDEAKNIFDTKTALFIDARPLKLYKKGTILGSLNVSPKMYKAKKEFMPVNKNALIVVFCQGYKCKKSDKVALKLQKDGYTNVKVYKGGFPEWNKAKYPAMGFKKPAVKKEEVKEDDNKKSKTYFGTKVYLGADEGMIDQFWFVKKVQNLPKNIVLVDVRNPKTYKAGHIKGAINVPYNAKANKIDTTKFPKDKLVVFYCNAGLQSSEAYQSLSKEEAKNVLYFDATVNCEGTKCSIEANEDL
jgi:rhodanese-related sulfurtransferase